ncbi:DegT/DnrJ/EryC1/StrS family aminotransferase [Burkholderia diffusa]|uniref:DegT/DnrJ/EryC1/StrS family aminotransferase n=1 Tax=Burkholderia diffusa TaxID=488732 RepID=UPI00075D2E29|nr:DegT/DnrJ/EryC1/StrS family aminotransferase [Burkholderia diffusa]KVN06953.1 cell wall biogenesis protein [Burkholderia diffusa]
MNARDAQNEPALVGRVPFVALDRQFRALRGELHEVLDRVGESGVYVLGDELEHFEAQLANYCGTNFAVGVASGADALFLVLKALNIGEGAEVITVPNSFIATAGAIVAAGARPVFVDVCEDLNLDCAQLEAAITPRTAAIMPVHLAGRMARMDEIIAIAARHGLPVIEDAAQALGAALGGRRAGTWGVAGCFSLHPLKNLGVYGDAGAITTNDAVLCARLRRLRNHGLHNRDLCAHWGYNSRFDALQAAFAAVKLRHLDDWNRRCRLIAERYRQAMHEWVTTPEERVDEYSIYHNFVILSDVRDALRECLGAAGVETRVHYPVPLHLQPAARVLGYAPGAFPVAESLAKRMLSLPIYPELQIVEIEQVVRAITEFFAQGAPC